MSNIGKFMLTKINIELLVKNIEIWTIKNPSKQVL